jgi:hypothetical protein
VSRAHLSAVAADAAAVATDRLAATGQALVEPPVESWPETTLSEGEFARLVSASYTWWKESWADDVALLGRLTGQAAVLRDFTRTLTLLRTAQQHDDVRDATVFFETWTTRACGSTPPATEADWTACGEALWEQLRTAAAALRAAARRARADRRLADRWSQNVAVRAAVDVADTRDVVLADLGLSYNDGDLAFVLRQLEASWKRRVRTVRDDAQAALEHVVERYLLGRALPELPCSYAEVLERLDLVGDPGAVSALLMAHSLAEEGYYRDIPEFLDQVEDFWRRLQGPAA